jgi:Carboxypeptidase regulatory-like domain
MNSRTQVSATIVCILSVLLWRVSVASAATLEGRTTLAKSAVSGALVRARTIDGPNIFVTRTDSNGHYALKDLLAGTYLLEVEVEGQLAFRARIEVREPATKRDIALITSESVPHVSIQIVKAVDDAVVTLNDVQVLRWGVDAGEIRRFALPQARNTLEIFVNSKPAGGSGLPIFGSRPAVPWQYHVIIRTSDGKKWEFKDGQEAAAEWLLGKRFPVLRGILIVDETSQAVNLVNVDRDIWKKNPFAHRVPSIQF